MGLVNMRFRIEILQALIEAEVIGKVEEQSEKNGFEIHHFSESGQAVPVKVGQKVIYERKVLIFRFRKLLQIDRTA